MSRFSGRSVDAGHDEKNCDGKMTSGAKTVSTCADAPCMLATDLLAQAISPERVPDLIVSL